MSKTTWYLIAALVIGFLLMGPLGALIGAIIWVACKPKTVNVVKKPHYSKK
jgi:predicted PurR-regulated permease PerM